MLFNFSTCITCKIKHELLMQKQITLRKFAKERALNEDKNYCIYFDEEDKELRIATYESATRRGENIIEVISRFINPV
jgi:hypothetical protein